MLGVILDTKDPCLNLATEEYLLHNRKEDFVILSVNDPSVIVGKHQCVHREVNTRYTESLKIPVLRRISGGGSVYHDHGNLNFAFIRKSEPGKQINFRLYTAPVVNYLQSAGINARFEGKNDIRVDGLKISGNAEHVYRERVLHHGTLLFDADLNAMRSSLNPVTSGYETRAVESNRSSVTNLKGMIGGIESMEQLTDSMMGYLSGTVQGLEPFSLTDQMIAGINNLADTKYRTWEWNYGYGPPYTFTGSFIMNNIKHRLKLLVRDGIVWECSISGTQEMESVAKKIIGCRHNYDDLSELFRNEKIPLRDDELWNFF
jgi:lipoate---protein ligase